MNSIKEVDNKMRLEFVNIYNDQALLNYIRDRHENGGVPVFRFYSILMYGIELKNLYPSSYTMQYLRESHFGDSDTFEFDRAYAVQLLQAVPSFMDLMSVISSLESEEQVIVLVDYTHPNAIPIIDSLIKYIQERYSINVYIYNDIGDINVLDSSDFQTKEGYMNYVEDMNRYMNLQIHMNPSLMKGIYEFMG